MIKKLITIIALTFSIGAWAEITNLKCEFVSFWDFEQMTFVEASQVPVSIIINTSENRVQVSDYNLNSKYREEGASILWNTMFTIKDGDELIMRYRRELDRVSGNYFKTFETAKVSAIALEDLSMNLIEKLNEESNWKKVTRTTNRCSKIEPLF